MVGGANLHGAQSDRHDHQPYRHRRHARIAESDVDRRRRIADALDEEPIGAGRDSRKAVRSLGARRHGPPERVRSASAAVRDDTEPIGRRQGNGRMAQRRRTRRVDDRSADAAQRDRRRDRRRGRLTAGGLHGAEKGEHDRDEGRSHRRMVADVLPFNARAAPFLPRCGCFAGHAILHHARRRERAAIARHRRASRRPCQRRSPRPSSRSPRRIRHG